MSASLATIPRSAMMPAPLPASRQSWIAALDEGRDALRAGAVLHFRADREIFADGESADTFFKVVSGTVRTCKFLNDGRRQIEAFYGPGDVFGFERDGIHHLSAEAVSECNLVAYRRRGVEAAFAEDGELARQLLNYALHSATDAQSHALLLGRRGAAEKVAAFLLEWMGRSGEPALAALPMSRQDMADYLGLTIETVSRTLSQFEREGLISIPNARQIRIARCAALQDLTA
jgi:CRP/FNR family nitrogen fixation transcriptional regulator